MLKSRANRRELHSSNSLVVVKPLLVYFLIINSSLILCHQNENHSALTNHLLLRVKRQQAGDNQTGGTNSNQQPRGAPGGATALQGTPAGSDATGSSNNNNNNNQDGNNQDDKAPEEALSSLKCDFGSSDSPDLCKFKILENANNPLSKSLTTWSHGSGKLALYQGGPLIDASDRNDTTGGYIFYETSNPYAGAGSPSPPLNQSSTHSSLSFTHHRSSMVHGDPYHQQQHYQMPSNHHQPQNDPPYSTLTTASFIKSNHRNSDLNSMNSNEAANNFQQLTSGRIAIGNSNSNNNNNINMMMAYGPAFISPNLTAPGPSGMCLSFKYAIQGLSAEELRISVNDHKTERSRQIWSSSESAGSNWTRGEVLYSVTNMHSLMFSASSGSASSVVKDLQQRKFRGYLALDEIEINKHDSAGGSDSAPCKGHCNFDGDLCGWTNAENGPAEGGDDFDWSFGRGSDNLFTGPARDFVSSTNNDLTGSYLHLDSGYPRRPGDRAILMSPMFQPTAVNDAMCMRLAVHMFGSGIGSLAIKIRYADADSAPILPAPTQPGNNNQASGGPANVAAASATRSSSGKGDSNNLDLIIWEMSGDAGNSWHQAQTSVSSAKSPFQVIIEGVVGENHLGNIAIDEISFSSGPCPTSPPIASKNYGDCTFEQSLCYWRNPDAEIHLDDLDWIRSADEQSIHGPNFDHTLKKRSGSYLKLENTFREPKSGTRAFLLSPIFQPKAQGNVQCLSFYYYMFMRSISSSGPNLGTIRVYLASNNELLPIWRLTNPISSPNWKHARASLSTALIDGQPTAPTKLFQIAFEGIWGDAPGGAIALDDITVFDGACDIMPPEAKSVPGECTFDVDMCSWSNKTSEIILPSISSSPDSSIDSNKSPFIQSVSNSALVSGAQSSYSKLSLSTSSSNMNKKSISWQLATIDSRPVNLQDHTYKAPIGYVYIDILENNNNNNLASTSSSASSSVQRVSYILQSFEVTVQSGQQISQCLSFWFAAYGRQDGNLLNVYLTQASAPPPPPEEGSNQPSPQSFSAGGRNNQQSSAGGPLSSSTAGQQQSGASQAGGGANSALSSSQSGGGSPSSSSGIAAGGSGSNSGDNSDAENANAWKMIEGKLIWSVSLRNITETNRRKWQYGQATIKADSNYIVRFVAQSNDGGFALDDISYYEGACETRPAHAKVITDEEESSPPVAPNNNPASAPS